MIFDIKTGKPVDPEITGTAQLSAEAATHPDTPSATLDSIEIQRRKWDACPHNRPLIDADQRTVQCGDCQMWIDPIWLLCKLVKDWKTDVAYKLKMIQEYEQKAKEAREKADAKRKAPRANLVRQRQENLERAAYNEYQAKILSIRSAKQYQQAMKIEAKIEAIDNAAETGR